MAEASGGGYAQLWRYRRRGGQTERRARGGERQWREQCRGARPRPPRGGQRRVARRLCLWAEDQGRAFEKGREMTDKIDELRELHVSGDSLILRSEERRIGNECVSTFWSMRSQYD